MKIPSFMNKFILIMGLIFAGQAFAAGEKCAANTTWGGFKTVIATKGADDYYEIDTPEKLAWFSCEITKTGTSSQKVNAKLTESIDLQGKLFIPISAGKGTPSFGGIFDGQGFTIKNLFIDASEIVKTTYGGDAKYAQNIGLFAALKGGTIQNLSLDNVAIYAASSAGDAGTSGTDNPISVGAVAGYLEAGTIKNCTVSGKIETSGATNRVGGIAGNVWAATISNCISEADVIATGNNTHVGGILGAVRKDGDVTINSCVYAGETLFSDNGAVGAVVGNYEKNKNITTNDLYYTADYPAVGTGLGNRPFNSTQVENLNTADVICELNGGTWNKNDNTCSGESADAAWSEGQDGLSMNGSDGFKVTFDANGGDFPEGAKTYKFIAKGASITANEIQNPTLANNKFAGWSLTKGGAVQDLGTADKAKTIYAVWKPIRTITFETAPGTFVDGTNEASKLVAEGDVVTVEGLPKLPVKFCAQGSVSDCDYFYGWSTQLHSPYENYDDVPAEAIVDLPTFTFSSNVTLHAIWVKAETYTVTFNANGRGQTEVAFVKVAKEEKTAQPPDPIAYDGYEFSGRWCEEIPCDDETKFDFNTEIKRNYVLYADWNVPKYNITYMINGKPNTTTGNPATYDVEDATITLNKPENAGDKFKGWYDENGNEVTTILSGSTGNITLYASWKYTITYLADNTLSATTSSDEKEHGVAKELKGATFVHGGCTQDGWSKVSYGKDGYNLDFAVNGSYEEDKDAILFPHWNCGTYSITYEVFGMSVTNRNPSQYTGPAKITLENAFDPAKKYFFMDNWYKESTFKNVIRDIQNIDANLTVYAKWYNKIYYKPGSNATGKAFEEKKYFDSTYTITALTDKFTRANYTIDGWSTSNGGEKVYELGETYTNNENLTLYPHWAENRDSIQYGAVKIYTYASDGRKEAVIDGNYTGSEVVDVSGETVSSVTFDRVFPIVEGGARSTIMLPFSISVDKTHGGTFYEFAQMDKVNGKWKVGIQKVQDGATLVANKPYIFIASESSLTFDVSAESPVTLNTSEMQPVTIGSWTFAGTYGYLTVGSMSDYGRVYGFSGEAKDGVSVGMFVKGGAGATIKPMRAYLVYNDGGKSAGKTAGNGFGAGAFDLPDEVEVVILDEQGNATERKILDVRTGVVRSGNWYDLQGRKLNGKPMTQGTYYHNGKLVVVK